MPKSTSISGGESSEALPIELPLFHGSTNDKICCFCRCWLLVGSIWARELFKDKIAENSDSLLASMVREWINSLAESERQALKDASPIVPMEMDRKLLGISKKTLGRMLTDEEKIKVRKYLRGCE